MLYCQGLLKLKNSFVTFFSITTRLNDAIERTTLANLNGVNNQIKDSLEKTLNSAGISQVIFAFIQVLSLFDSSFI